MKKLFLFLVFFLGSLLPIQAQSQYYHKVGDTIRGRDTIYFYQWWSEDWLSNPNHKLYYDLHLRDNDMWFAEYDCINATGRYVRYNYTEQPLKIVGLAGCVRVSVSHGTWGTMDMEVEPFHEEQLLLYDAQTDAFPLLAEVPFTRVEPVRYMELPLRGVPQNYSSFACCVDASNHNWNLVVPVHEYYFDKPVTVHDSFYVGMTTNDAFRYFPPEYQSDSNHTAAYAWNICMFPYVSSLCTSDSCPAIPPQLYKVKEYRWDDSGNVVDTSWRWMEIPSFTLIFPIIEIDTSLSDGPQYVCPPVENLHIANVEERNVVLLWNNNDEHLRWEISYGPQGTAPEDGTQLMASIPAIMVQGLDSCVHYSVYIRAVCMHDSLHYSEWSEPMDICICDTDAVAGVVAPLVEQLTYLMPNPAAEQVQVLSSYGITRVEAYSLQGTKMADSRVRGLGTSLDVRNWPAGLYIVVVHTPAGNVTKKLVVDR